MNNIASLFSRTRVLRYRWNMMISGWEHSRKAREELRRRTIKSGKHYEGRPEPRDSATRTARRNTGESPTDYRQNFVSADVLPCYSFSGRTIRIMERRGIVAGQGIGRIVAGLNEGYMSRCALLECLHHSSLNPPPSHPPLLSPFPSLCCPASQRGSVAG